jgi:hypothetical protein
MRKLLTRESYLNDLKTNYYSKYTGIGTINEEAPFVNDLPWGDTHIGRMINSFARKAKIKMNLTRISGLTNRLKSIFDDMVETGSLEFTDDSISMLFIEISTLLSELKKSVEDEEEVDLIISTTQQLINLVTKYNFDEKEIMLKALNEFLDFLKSLKKGQIDDDSDDESLKPEEIEKKKKFDEVYMIGKSFLQSVVSLHDDIKMNVVRFKEKEFGQSVNRQTQFDKLKYNEIKTKYEKAQQKDKLSLLRQLVQMCENGLDAAKSKKDKAAITQFENEFNKYSGILIGMERDSRNKPQSSTTTSKLNKPGDSVGIKKLTKVNASLEIESLDDSIFEEANPSSGIANVEEGESNAKNAWRKVINAYNQSKIATFIPQIEQLLNTTTKGDKENLKKAKDNILKICKQCVLNKSTVGKPITFDQLIKEDVNINDVSKSISLFGRILLAYKEDLGLTGSYGRASKSINNFVNSFVKLEKVFSTIKEEKIETKKESLINSYNSFIMMFEKNEFSDKIKEKFNEIFTDDVTKHFNVTKERMSEIENSIKEREGGQLVFNSADPIIEIVRLFNRAWRIHTPGVIPSGRTGGRVSNSVFREYENLGDGAGTPDQPGSGPYRNIELFEKWNEAVQDILSDTKYRPIFSDKAIFRFINEETGKEGDPIERGGKTLLKFINELLSDSKMYRKGAMNNFITEYFKLSETQQNTLGGLTSPGFGNDLKNNNEVTDSIVVSDVIFKKMEQVKSLDPFGNDLWKAFNSRTANEFEKLAFRISVKAEKEDVTYYCVYLKTDTGYPLFLFSKKNFPFDLTKVKGPDIKPANLVDIVNLGSLPKGTGTFKVGSDAKIRFVSVTKDTVVMDDVNGGNTQDRIEFIINKIEILCDSKSGEAYLDFNNYVVNKKAAMTKNLKVATGFVKMK